MDWWIDNGATKHVTNCQDLFVEFKKFETAQDSNKNSEFKSATTRCWLEVDGKTVLCGDRKVCGTLYKAAIKPITPEKKTEINAADTDSSTLQLYHERLGHQDKRHVKMLLEKELGIKVKLNKEPCEPCIFGKAHRLPFGTSWKEAAEPGELMSTDVCGPFDESFKKKRYLVVFKDSYTKFRYGFLVREKSEVKNVLRQMIAHAKIQGHSIKELLSDNGGEF
ncbi:retrovirus-related pol polyprotein from transposon tnt 1-94, partial [Lasius niger]